MCGVPRRLVSAVVLLCLCAFGCSPAKRVDLAATTLGLDRLEIAAGEFQLIGYSTTEGRRPGPLHIYIGGDGTPWTSRTKIAADPTQRHPLTLRLMAMDESPSVFLGRPCYHGRYIDDRCGAWFWTWGRYSQTVVDILSEAARKLIREGGFDEVVVIGYSGGGVLAWHLAQELSEVSGLITVAAPLDIEAWTDLHDYTPLMDSLNPAEGPPMRGDVWQVHIIGMRDQNVPQQILTETQQNLAPKARIIAVDATHRCCWERLWPELLQDALSGGRR